MSRQTLGTEHSVKEHRIRVHHFECFSSANPSLLMDRLPEKKMFLLIQRFRYRGVGRLHVISVLDKGGRNGEDEKETYTTNFKKTRK
jgi:hypothetical protein